MATEGCVKDQTTAYEPYRYYLFEDSESPSGYKQEFCYKDGSSYSWINSSYFIFPLTEVNGIDINENSIIIIDNNIYYSSDLDYNYDKNNNILINHKYISYIPNYKEGVFSHLSMCSFDDPSLSSNHSYLINHYYVLHNPSDSDSNKYYIKYSCENNSLSSDIVDIASLNNLYSNYNKNGYLLTKDKNNSNKYIIENTINSQKEEIYKYKDNIYLYGCSYNNFFKKYVDHEGNILDKPFNLYHVKTVIIISVIIAIVLICLSGWLTKKWLICSVVIVIITVIVDLIIHLINKNKCDTMMVNNTIIELTEMK